MDFNKFFYDFFKCEDHEKKQILHHYLIEKLISTDLENIAKEENLTQVRFEKILSDKSVSSSVSAAASQDAITNFFICLPDDYSTLLDFEPTKQPKDSIFYLDSPDLEKIFLMQLFYQIVQQASFEKIQFSGEWILLYYLIFELGKQEYLLFPMTLKNFLDEFKSFLGTHHLSYGLTISKQLHTLLRLLVVDSGVKFDRKFEQFNISAECSLSEKIRLDSYNKKMISHYQTVGKKGIVKHQGIRGDGNCYYGAVAYDVLRRLVLYPSDLEFISNTYQQFNRAYDLIEKYYTQEKDSFKESHQLMMRSFFNDDGQFILRFIHDLDRLYFNDEKFYLPMIRTFRMLLADVIEKNKDQAFNDLTLENYINFDQEMEIKQWIECNVLVLGKCAEGAPINLALLPKIFKCAQCILTLHREEPFYETLVPLENATPIILCFTPGHYDLFNTNEMQKNIDTNRYQFYQDKTGGLFKPPVRLSLAYKLDKNWNTSPKILLSAIFLIFKCLANLAFIFVNMCIYLVNFIGLNFPQLDPYQFSTLSLSPC